MQFTATEIHADYDEFQNLIIAFASGNKLEGQEYFMIQYSLEKNDQFLGSDAYYIEKNDQSMSCYGGIEDVFLTTNRLILTLDNRGIDRIKEKRIVIDFDADEVKRLKLREKIHLIFNV